MVLLLAASLFTVQATPSCLAKQAGVFHGKDAILQRAHLTASPESLSQSMTCSGDKMRFPEIEARVSFKSVSSVPLRLSWVNTNTGEHFDQGTIPSWPHGSDTHSTFSGHVFVASVANAVEPASALSMFRVGRGSREQTVLIGDTQSCFMHSSAGQDEWEMMQKDQALVREAENTFLETRNTTTLQEAYKDLLQRHSPGNRSVFASKYTTSTNAWLLAMVRHGRIQELKGNVTAAHQFYKSAALNGSRDGYFRLALLIFSRQEGGSTSSSDSGSSSGNTDEIESTAKFYARCAAAAGHGLARHLVGYKQLSEIDVEDEVSSNGSGGGFGINARPEMQVAGTPLIKTGFTSASSKRQEKKKACKLAMSHYEAASQSGGRVSE